MSCGVDTIDDPFFRVRSYHVHVLFLRVWPSTLFGASLRNICKTMASKNCHRHSTQRDIHCQTLYSHCAIGCWNLHQAMAHSGWSRTVYIYMSVMNGETITDNWSMMDRFCQIYTSIDRYRWYCCWPLRLSRYIYTFNIDIQEIIHIYPSISVCVYKRPIHVCRAVTASRYVTNRK